EVYGGALLNPWFDRDLSIAGRVSYLDRDGAIAHGLVDFKEPVAVIPSLAIHLDRDANESRSINQQTYLPPVLGRQGEDFDLKTLLRQRLEEAGAGAAEILDHELVLYDTQPPALVGLEREFIASARLDNLLSCFAGMRALLEASGEAGALLVCNDHEEVGSTTASGARGPMLNQMLERLLPDPEERNRALPRSMLISADNAHGVHPNFADRHDDNHGPLLNRGPVIKMNANQRYATNSETAAVFRRLAADEGVAVQTFVVRSDMACGSTIGPLTAAETGVRTVDVGVPQWAMHSVRELAGAADAFNLSRVLRRFFDAAAL
ncbi:MAG: M18 family aminopeptidase, partial [Deltaproteobacteria bacterium]|nr:M18 family aminopeptidase [Deltaproteobacteria bacterium]